MEVSVIEYLGKVEDGILVLLSIIYENKYYEATFFYNEKDILLTINAELEDSVGDIKNHPQYQDLLRDIMKKVVPFSEMIDKIDSVDFGRWIEGLKLENDEDV